MLMFSGDKMHLIFVLSGLSKRQQLALTNENALSTAKATTGSAPIPDSDAAAATVDNLPAQQSVTQDVAPSTIAKMQMEF